MKTLIVCSSANPESRSTFLGRMACDWLRGRGVDADCLEVKPRELPPCFNIEELVQSPLYRSYYEAVAAADNLIFSSPVYNWGICGDLKLFIEAVGSTDSSRESPFFDKLVSCILAGGLPHSYMAVGSLMMPMMLDFRCLVNPYHAYLHNRHWNGALGLEAEAREKLELMLEAHLALGERLAGYRFTRKWTV